MSEQKLTACKKCNEKGVPEQYIDFEKLGDGSWKLTDHGTDRQHSHRKKCEECGTPIYYDPNRNRYRNANEMEHDLHDCRGNPGKYGLQPKDVMDTDGNKVTIKAQIGNEFNEARQAVEEVQTESINTVAETNPIKEKLEQTSLPTALDRRLDLMWTMIKTINEKMDDVKAVKINQEKLLISLDKYLEKNDNITAHILSVLEGFKPASQIPRNPEEAKYKRIADQPVPNEEEMNNIFAEDEEEKI